MKNSKRYNSVHVKDKSCAVCTYLLIFGSGLFDDVIKISPLPTTVAMATIFWTKLTIARPPWRIIASCFHLSPYFRARPIRLCHLNFFPADPRCHGNEFWDTIDYNSAPVEDICPLFAFVLYFRARAFRRCHLNLSPADPRCHGNEFWEKIDYKSAPARYLHLPLYFRARAIRWCHLNLSHDDPCCHGN